MLEYKKQVLSAITKAQDLDKVIQKVEEEIF